MEELGFQRDDSKLGDLVKASMGSDKKVSLVDKVKSVRRKLGQKP